MYDKIRSFECIEITLTLIFLSISFLLMECINCNGVARFRGLPVCNAVALWFDVLIVFWNQWSKISFILPIHLSSNEPLCLVRWIWCPALERKLNIEVC